jgi:CHASE2 domain-containing sensor protein
MTVVAGLALAAHFIGIGRASWFNDYAVVVYLWSSAIGTLLAIASLCFRPMPKIMLVAVALILGNFVVSFLVAVAAYNFGGTFEPRNIA